MGFCSEYLVEVDDVLMVESAMVVYLAGEVGSDRLWDLLDRTTGPCQAVRREMDGAVCPCKVSSSRTSYSPSPMTLPMVYPPTTFNFSLPSSLPSS